MVFEEVTKKSVLLLPIGASDDGAHSQNEKLNREGYEKGMEVFAKYIAELGKLWKSILLICDYFKQFKLIKLQILIQCCKKSDHLLHTLSLWSSIILHICCYNFLWLHPYFMIESFFSQEKKIFSTCFRLWRKFLILSLQMRMSWLSDFVRLSKFPQYHVGLTIEVTVSGMDEKILSKWMFKKIICFLTA